ncbi:MAG: hypothetical protein ACI36V_03260 [Coriobacteriales bacterium]
MADCEGRRAGKREYPRSRVRAANAWLAAGLGLLFCVHLLLGALLVLWPGMPSSLAWVVWIGAAAAAVHVALSAATTYTMFTDKERPASARKRAHQKLKWLTGVLLLAAVGLHQLTLSGVIGAGEAAAPYGLPSSDFAVLLGAAAMIAAGALLAVHLCTGVKSLTRDLDLPGAARTPIKAASIACAALAAALVLYAALRALL